MKINLIIKFSVIFVVLSERIIAKEKPAGETLNEWLGQIDTIRVLNTTYTLKWASKVNSETLIYLQIPCISPLIPKQNHRITSGYGRRIHPIKHYSHFHFAIDIAALPQDVFATASGLVCKAAYEEGLGWYVLIDHLNGFKTLYGHLANVLVKPKQYIEIGNVVGVLGKSGRTTGYHLHYAIYKNQTAVNPLPYLDLLSKAY